jgi:hypothetical protein
MSMKKIDVCPNANIQNQFNATPHDRMKHQTANIFAAQ